MILFKAIGIFVRWMFKGFRGRFIDIWNNQNSEMLTGLIGFVVLVLFSLLIMKIHI